MELFDHYKKFIIIIIACIVGLFGVAQRLSFFQKKKSIDTPFKRERVVAKTIIPDTKSREASIAVFVSGEVKKPGVYWLLSSARIGDALRVAGGFSDHAAKSSINLAAKLIDGQQIYFPTQKEVSKKRLKITSPLKDGQKKTEGSATSSSQPAKVNINTADQEELETLTGIGPATSKKILAYRQQHGSFSSLDDLKNISGIGDKKVEALFGEATVK